MCARIELLPTVTTEFPVCRKKMLSADADVIFCGFCYNTCYEFKRFKE